MEIIMPFTESSYEHAIIQLFTETLGYSYIYGPDIDRDYHSPALRGYPRIIPAAH